MTYYFYLHMANLPLSRIYTMPGRGFPLNCAYSEHQQLLGMAGPCIPWVSPNHYVYIHCTAGVWAYSFIQASGASEEKKRRPTFVHVALYTGLQLCSIVYR